MDESEKEILPKKMLQPLRVEQWSEPIPKNCGIPKPDEKPALEEVKFASIGDRLRSYDSKVEDSIKSLEDKLFEEKMLTEEEKNATRLEEKKERLRKDRALREEQRIKMRELRIVQMKRGE